MTPVAFGSLGIDLPAIPSGNILDDINDVARDAQDIYNEYVRDPLKTRGGRIVRNCIAGGGPFAVAAKLGGGYVSGAFVFGCAFVNVVRRGR